MEEICFRLITISPTASRSSGQAMKERKYYYIVECSNGINRMSTYMRATNHWEAEDLARNEYHKKFLAWPVNVESRKSTKTECDIMFPF